MSRDDLRICTPPPWGALTAIDLNTGRVKWWVPLGSFLCPRSAYQAKAGR